MTEEQKKSNSSFAIQIIAIIVLAGLVIFGVANKPSASGNSVSGNSITPLPASEILPVGVPKVYGTEIGVRYEDISESNPNVQATIQKLTVLLGDDPGNVLKGSTLERYVKIGSMIACEYCCGATTLVFKDGQPACGCAHSYAMRGVLGYLVKNHPEMTDDQILEEIGKWKVLFFPQVHQLKAAVLQSNGIELNYINLASNKYRGIENGVQAGGGQSQVGGC